MESLALFFSGFGRLAPKPFAHAVVAVYVAAFLSQLLISPPVMLRIGLAAFALVQAMAMWAWFCLHAKRLRARAAPTHQCAAHIRAISEMKRHVFRLAETRHGATRRPISNQG